MLARRMSKSPAAPGLKLEVSEASHTFNISLLHQLMEWDSTSRHIRHGTAARSHQRFTSVFLLRVGKHAVSAIIPTSVFFFTTTFINFGLNDFSFRHEFYSWATPRWTDQ